MPRPHLFSRSFLGPVGVALHNAGVLLHDRGASMMAEAAAPKREPSLRDIDGDALDREVLSRLSEVERLTSTLLEIAGHQREHNHAANDMEASLDFRLKRVEAWAESVGPAPLATIGSELPSTIAFQEAPAAS
jgi:hypothetical protein